MAQPPNGHFRQINYQCQAPSISGCALEFNVEVTTRSCAL